MFFTLPASYTRTTCYSVSPIYMDKFYFCNLVYGAVVYRETIDNRYFT